MVLYLIAHTFYGDCNNIKIKRFVTFYNLRLDSMAELNIDDNSFITMFNDRLVISMFYIFIKIVGKLYLHEELIF